MKKEQFIEIRNIKFHEVRWIPETEIKGIIQISHGVTEYILRYDSFANYFVDKGYLICGFDICGHGLTKTDSFGNENSWFLNSEDIYSYYKKISIEYQNVPYIFLGFSLGSFLVRTVFINHPELTNAILVGTGYQSNLEIALAKLLIKKEIKKLGYNSSSKIIDKLTFDNYNKKVKDNQYKFSWLCSNTEEVIKYEQDKNKKDFLTTGLFNEMLTGIKYTCDYRNICKMNKKSNILLISGMQDPVGNNGVGVTKLCQKLIDNNINATIKLVEGRHDLFHEENHENTYKYILNWIGDLNEKNK